MNVSAAIYSIRWLVRDTFRQARASGLFWLMLTVSAVCILVCLSAGVDGTLDLNPTDEPVEFLTRSHPGAANAAKAREAGLDIISGDLTLAFGTIRVPLGRDGRDAVRFLQLLLAGGVADAAGILLTLIWTAGFLPTFLEPSAASVLLAKPVPRWSLLAGKYLGVLTFVGFQAVVFVMGTWLALGVSTGVWDPVYLWCIPLLLLHFSIFFSASTLLAVWTRSTIACVLGSLLFWVLCWATNCGRHAIVQVEEIQGVVGSLSWLMEAAYWVLPKPADLGAVLFDALQAGNHFRAGAPLPNGQTAVFAADLSVLTSIAFTIGMLFAAGRQFLKTDY